MSFVVNTQEQHLLPEFHRCIVYVDESGDHGPISLEYPVFVLAFCVFDKMRYAREVTTAVQELKFRYFGNDAVVLHEREIRKRIQPFNILQRKNVNESFMDDISRIIEKANFTLIAAVIRKNRYKGTDNIYHLAMQFGLESIAHHYGLTENDPTLHMVCESRGRCEDDQLELAFHRICLGQNRSGSRLPCSVIFSGKEGCHAGMEIADLIARPIGRHVLNPEQPNRAWDIIKKKFPNTESGYPGLKIFP